MMLLTMDDYLFKKLRRNLLVLPREKWRERAILVLGGSLNPIHECHIDIFHSASAALQKQGIDVIAGFLALSTDEWILNKQRRANVDEDARGVIGFTKRFLLAELACKSSHIVTVYPEAEPDASVLLEKLESEARRFLPNIRGFILCGEDLLGAYPQCNVIYAPRNGWTSSTALDERRSLRKRTLTIELNCPHLNGLSSTICRKLIRRGDWDSLVSSGMMNKNVICLLREWVTRNELFIEN
jgi:nicotinic acid mononucleotide adenylyltransferase